MRTAGIFLAAGSALQCRSASLGLVACDLGNGKHCYSMCMPETSIYIVDTCACITGAAAELALTARNVPGPEAASLGLVSRCYDSPSDMMTGVTAMAQQIAEKSPLAVTGTKQILLHTR
eukprot:GHUV01038680.1.p1 GENE.GHUV01038680.1~~GHUV01038680.1.p1  ORF type:complete len:119 (-),score=16.10 GHUV01038680.1:40-396(-)